MYSLKRVVLKKKLTELAYKKNLEIYDKKPFEKYVEGSDDLFNEEVAKSFANIMSEVTQLTIKKLKKQTHFDNYKIMERISHCLFNNMGGLAYKSEEQFLAQRFKERIGQPFDGDFENKLLKS